MADTKSREDLKTELIHQLLKERLGEGSTKETAYFAFEELEQHALLKDRTGLKKTFEKIEEGTAGDISFGYRSGILRHSERAAYPDAPARTVPIGVEIHVSDPAKLAEYFSLLANHPIRLSEHPVRFDDKEHSVIVGPRRVTFPNALNEHLLCRVMFRSRVNTATDWSEIYEEMTGNDPLMKGRKQVSGRHEIAAHARMVRDTMHAANKRVREDINTEDDLFFWQNKSVTRNY